MVVNKADSDDDRRQIAVPLMPLSPDKIRKSREALDLTQAEAAKRAHMPQSVWGRIESGDRSDPALSTAERVALALKVPLTDLLLPYRREKKERTTSSPSPEGAVAALGRRVRRR